ncbi:MAG: ChbG/HpnK family deacetylase [Bacteroidota bacterium]
MEAEKNKIRLLVRGDDIGSSHSANVACIKSYTDGILRSVELMTVCPWFEEACILLNQHEDLDVGIHLTITSEWETVKWKPITNAKSLIDDNGCFYPMVSGDKYYPKEKSIAYHDWKLEEIETEFRAQIELGLKRLGRASHLSYHMNCHKLDSKLETLCVDLAKEYNLIDIEIGEQNIQQINGYRGVSDHEERVEVFIQNLKDLSPGDYLFIDHPSLNTEEMKATRHHGYEHVAEDRYSCFRVFTNKKIMQVIDELGIELINYTDLKR